MNAKLLAISVEVDGKLFIVSREGERIKVNGKEAGATGDASEWTAQLFIAYEFYLTLKQER